MWEFLTTNVLKHETGFQIALNSGSWQNPGDIEPTVPQGMNPANAAMLMREALIFASRHPRSRPVIKSVQPAPSKNTLSLRKTRK